MTRPRIIGASIALVLLTLAGLVSLYQVLFDLGARLDAASDSAMICHQEQAARIGIGRTTYFEVKAGRGGKQARQRAEEYLRSLQIKQ